MLLLLVEQRLLGTTNTAQPRTVNRQASRLKRTNLTNTNNDRERTIKLPSSLNIINCGLARCSMDTDCFAGVAVCGEQAPWGPRNRG